MLSTPVFRRWKCWDFVSKRKETKWKQKLKYPCVFSSYTCFFFLLQRTQEKELEACWNPSFFCLSNTLNASDTLVQLVCFQRVKKVLLAGKQHQQLPAVQLSEERACFLLLGGDPMLVFQRAETIRVTSSHLLLKASYTQSRQLDSHYPCLLVRFSKKKESPPKVLQPLATWCNFPFSLFLLCFSDIILQMWPELILNLKFFASASVLLMLQMFLHGLSLNYSFYIFFSDWK